MTWLSRIGMTMLVVGGCSDDGVTPQAAGESGTAVADEGGGDNGGDQPSATSPGGSGTNADADTAATTDDDRGTQGTSDDGRESESTTRDDASTSSTSGDESTSSTSGDESTSSTSDDQGSSTSDDGGNAGLGPSAGCGSMPGSILNGVIAVAGVNRQYLIELPPAYDETIPYPVVFAWHGLTEGMGTAALRYQVTNNFGGEAIGIYPHKPNGAEWDLTEGGLDVPLFDTLLQTASDQLCLDLDRVFVLGFSSGGLFVRTLMCLRGEQIRAGGGGGTPPAEGTCPVPVGYWGAHASNDEIEPYASGLADRDMWRAINGCANTSAAVPTLPIGSCVAYDDCAAPTVWCDYGGGHWWMETWMNPSVFDFFTSIPPL